MKKFILLALLVSTVAYAATPFIPEIEARFAALEAGTAFLPVTSDEITDGEIVTADIATGGVATVDILDGTILQTDIAVQSTDGLHLKRIARATLDCTDGTTCPVGATSLGVSLPAKALITRSYIYVVTQLADTGTCTVAISCEDANNIKTATDLTGTAAAGFIEGASTGTAATFQTGIAATCAITATVADGGSCVPTAGKLIVFVEYAVID